MSKLEKIKTLIDFLKTIIITLIVGLFGMISFLVVNIEKITSIQATLTLTGVIFDLLILVLMIKFTLKKINDLERL